MKLSILNNVENKFIYTSIDFLLKVKYFKTYFSHLFLFVVFYMN